MLESDDEPLSEGSGTMLFQALKSLLMIIPQSTCYNLLRDRLTSTSRFRQSVIAIRTDDEESFYLTKETEVFVNRVLYIRDLHFEAVWKTIRVESLELAKVDTTEEEKKQESHEEGSDRRDWLGYESKEDEIAAQARHREEKRRRQTSGVVVEELDKGYDDFESLKTDSEDVKELAPNDNEDESWKAYWVQDSATGKS